MEFLNYTLHNLSNMLLYFHERISFRSCVSFLFVWRPRGRWLRPAERAWRALTEASGQRSKPQPEHNTRRRAEEVGMYMYLCPPSVGVRASVVCTPDL
jgi:hypothetical protein